MFSVTGEGSALAHNVCVCVCVCVCEAGDIYGSVFFF